MIVQTDTGWQLLDVGDLGELDGLVPRHRPNDRTAVGLQSDKKLGKSAARQEVCLAITVAGLDYHGSTQRCVKRSRSWSLVPSSLRATASNKSG